MPIALKAEGITVRFGGVVAVDNVDLTLEKGKTVGIIGPNGAGKTTFFNAVTGFVPVSTGEISFFDQRVTTLPAYKRTHLGMGRTFQTERPFEELTVLENVLVAAYLRTSRSKEATEIAMQALSQVGLEDRAHQPAADLNLARLRRLELARALATQPKVLFLDEIMAGLNPPALQSMIEFVRSLVKDGMSILMVEHIMEAIIELSDHVLVLANGKLIAEGMPKEVLASEQVIDAYLGTD